MRDSLPTHPATDPSECGRQRMLSLRGEPLFVARWDRALFIHFELEPKCLQPEVPFALDLREGRAYVSLVAFTMRGMRFRRGGPIGAWLCTPIASHGFLNVRTYVRYRDEPGILFLTEWLPSRLSICLGPTLFGLPYRRGKIEYHHAHEGGTFRGRVVDAPTGVGLKYHAHAREAASFTRCLPESLDEFLLERYTAFTCRAGKRRFFRIWHPPWLQTPLHVTIDDNELLARTFGWFAKARLIGAHYSPGVRNVWMGWPHRIVRPADSGRSRALSAMFELP